MQPHGPDTEAFNLASTAELGPVKLEGTMAFMFETVHPQRVSTYAAHLPQLQDHYADCWAGLEKRFTGAPSEPSNGPAAARSARGHKPC